MFLDVFKKEEEVRDKVSVANIGRYCRYYYCIIVGSIIVANIEDIN